MAADIQAKMQKVTELIDTFTCSNMLVAECLLGILKTNRDVSSIDQIASARCTSNRPGYKVLKDISLLEHSLDVAIKIMTIIERKRLLFELGVAAALAHDLGKIPKFHDPRVIRYDRTNHAIASAVLLDNLFRNTFSNSEEFATVEYAVRYHHTPFRRSLVRGTPAEDHKFRLLMYLKEADEAARIDEYLPDGVDIDSTWRRSPLVAPADDCWDDEPKEPTLKLITIPWFDPGRLLEGLFSRINSPASNNISKGDRLAFDHGGFCYFSPTVLFDVLKSAASGNELAQLHLIESDPVRRKGVLAFIVGVLIKHGYIVSELLPKGYYCWRYFVHFHAFGKRAYWLVPVKSAVFGKDMRLRNNAKAGTVLNTIRSVVPMDPDRNTKK